MFLQLVDEAAASIFDTAGLDFVSVGFQVFLSLVQGTNLIQRLINVAYTYDNLAHRWQNTGVPKIYFWYLKYFRYNLHFVFSFNRVLKAQSDHRSRHEGENLLKNNINIWHS